MLSKFLVSSRFFAFIHRVIHEMRTDVKLNKLADLIAVPGSALGGGSNAEPLKAENLILACNKSQFQQQDIPKDIFFYFYDILANRCTA